MGPEFRSIFGRVVAMVLAFALVSCGGGSTVASNGSGVGTGGTGISSGTVVGFGSVVVDGDAYDSSTPSYLAGTDQSEAAAAPATALALGAQVVLTLDSAGSPTSALVDPELDGAVANLNTGAQTFTVNGVLVVANANAAAGPVTYYSGLAGFGGLAAGTQVEVHGAFGVGAGGQGYIQATLIQQLPPTNPVTRVSGLVSNLGASNFSIGGITVQDGAATLQPADATLADGEYVTAWSNQALSGSTMQAAVVRVHGLLGTASTARVGGLVYALSGTRFSVGGTTVDASATGVASVLATLADGDYVTVQGRVSDGTLVAGTITVPTTQQVELRGTISGYVDASTNFVVRGTVIDAASAQAAAGANAGLLGNGVYVDIVGTASGNVVVARSLQVESSSPSGGVVDLQGRVSQVDTAAGTFTLSWQRDGSVQTSTVSLAANVVYANGSASSLVNGAQVQIEASSSGASLSAFSVAFQSVAGPGGGNADTEGVVYDLDSVNHTFAVNGITIQQNGVTPSGGTLVNGARVEVEFTTSGGLNLATAIAMNN